MKRLLIGLMLLVACGATARVLKETISTAGTSLEEVDISQFAWKPWGEGYEKTADGILVDNGDNGARQAGGGPQVVLNQKIPQLICVSVESKALNASDANPEDYSLYLDIKFMDGTDLYGQKNYFSSGTHDWEKASVAVMPARPIRYVNCWLLFRKHKGRAEFRNLRFQQAPWKEGALQFDSVALKKSTPYTGFQLRDVEENSNFVSFENGKALGVSLETSTQKQGDAEIITAVLKAENLKKDRLLHLVYTRALDGEWTPLQLMRTPQPLYGREYSDCVSTKVGLNGRLARYPMAAVERGKAGEAVGIDLFTPAVARNGYNMDTRELFVSYDIALTPEKPTATVRVFHFPFQAGWGFRSALEKLYRVYPEAFKLRLPKQGLWMAFHPISKVKGWEDFGFAIKEGNGETEWDDAHDMVTFRYTEPMTWWQRIPKEEKSTVANASRLAAEQAKVEQKTKWNNANLAKAWEASVFRDRAGKPQGNVTETPWCNGVVWSMNSMPGLAGEYTDYKVKWAYAKEQFHGPQAKGHLEGEYIDSSEGYVTREMDFAREHFAAASTPLTYEFGLNHVGIYRGLVTFEYCRAIERDMRAMGKLMMANSTPNRLWWLGPLMDVTGTEANWNHNNNWNPPADYELLYRRAVIGPKFYCFLQNTEFTQFPYEYSEKYMKRSLFYGMFASYFSANAATGHYFSRPELYDRDRPLFKKYVPLCRMVSEAGWQPVTLARSNSENIWVERYGKNLFTVFNAGNAAATAAITFEAKPGKAQELVEKRALSIKGKTISFELGPEDVAILSID